MTYTMIDATNETTNDTTLGQRTLQTTEQTVKLTVSKDPQMNRLNVDADPPYLTVGDGVTAIVWEIDASALDPVERAMIEFDEPGITFHGPRPNVLIEAPSRTERVGWWRNDMPGRTFAYDVHLVEILTTAGPGQPAHRRRIAIHEDPIVHNDPPSGT